MNYLVDPAPARFIGVNPVKKVSEAGARGASPLATYNYVIITNEAMKTAFQALATHKSGQGYSARIVTTDTDWDGDGAADGGIYGHFPGTRPDGGTDNATRIREFVQYAYSNWSTEYVVLGGDADGDGPIIPHRGVYGIVNNNFPTHRDPDNDIPCDLYFGGLDGDWDNDTDGIYGERYFIPPQVAIWYTEADLYAEVFVGRIPADTAAEATRAIDKIIAFENTTPGQKVLLIGHKLCDDDPETPYYDEETWGGDYKDGVYGEFSDHWSSFTRYQKDGDTGNLKEFNALCLNDHQVVNHMGHGWTNQGMGLVSSDVDNLSNTTFYLVYTQACYTNSIDNRGGTYGSYNGTDSFSKHFITENDHGAFAYIGNSRYGWYRRGSTNGASQVFDRAFFDAIFDEGKTRIGEALADAISDNAAGMIGQGADRFWAGVELCLLGDPTTEIAVGQPPGPPTAPSNMTSTGVTNSLITWQWSDNSNDEDGFHFYSDAGNHDFSAGAVSHQDPGLSVNTRYWAYVTAYNGNGESSASNTHYVYTLANQPSAQGFTDITNASIRANWGANGNPSGTLYYCENTTKGTNSGWTSSLSWNSAGLSSSTSYTFRVKARNGDGTETVWTALGSETTNSTPTVPPSPNVTVHPSGTTNDRTPFFDWDYDGVQILEYCCRVSTNSNPDLYQYYVWDHYITVTGEGNSQDQVTTELNDGFYYWFIYQMNSVGYSQPATGTFTVDADAPPPAPIMVTFPTGTISETTPYFDWQDGSDPSGIIEYCMRIDSESDPEATPGYVYNRWITNTGSSTSQDTVDPLVDGFYWWFVYQRNGNQVWSPHATGTFTVDQGGGGPGPGEEQITVQVSSTSDDVSWRYSSPTGYVGTINVMMGYYSGGYMAEGGFRFRNITIPKETVIHSASVKFCASPYPESKGSPTYRLRAVTEDNAPIWTESYNPVVCPKTDAYVVWAPPPWTDGNWYTTPDISNVIQEVVNRPGWNSGNALSIVPDNTMYLDNYYRQASTYERGSSYAAQLIIVYEAPSAPEAPTSMRVSSIGYDAIFWSWDDNSDNENGFNFYCSVDNHIFSANTTSCYDSGLSVNSQYWAYVNAFNGTGISGNSNTYYVYTAAKQPTAQALSDVTSNSIRANWSANGNPSGTEYYCENLTRGTDSGWITSTTWLSTGLAPNTSYTLRVRARNHDNQNTSTVSLGSETTLDVPPTAPSDMRVTAKTSDSIDWAWDDNSNNETGFNFYGSAGGDTLGANVTTKTTGSLGPNIQYSAYVKSYNGQGESSKSNTCYAYTYAAPPSSQPLSDVTDISIRANWGQNGNLSGTLYYCENTTAETNSGWTSNLFWNSTGLSPSTGYTFRVKARNGDGDETAWTNLGSETTLDYAPPPAPTDVDDGIEGWSADDTPIFTWTAPADPGGIEGYYFAADNPNPESGGDWTMNESGTLTAQTDGIHTFYVQALNGYSVVGEAGSHQFKIDATAPGAPTNVDDGVEGPSGDLTPTFSWTSPGDTSGISGYYYGVNDPSPESGGGWTDQDSVTLSEQTDGTHTFYVKAKNGSGLTGPAGSHEFIIDGSIGPDEDPPVISNVQSNVLSDS
ncbi:MAG: C25 family cysteine peptidase, partial [Candidatus Erginobacter occultus]|nr:C25 family cysteine peptidase [Candidatus Erginobacter occultus]